ncbi:hypothetical protein D3C85_857200 [compost metagenome]
MGPRRCHSSRLGMRQPSENSSGGKNRNRNNSGSNATCKPSVGNASTAPAPIWTSGRGNGINRPSILDTMTSVSRMRTV